MEVIAYARMSTSSQIASADVQHCAISRMCLARGWVVVKYVEETLSGVCSLSERPILNSVIQNENVTGKALVVYSLDRLARSPIVGLDIIKRFVDAGFIIYSVVEALSSTDWDIAQVRRIFEHAEWERNSFNHRSKEGLLRLTEKWGVVERPPSLRNYVTRPPYGYARNKNYHISDPRAFEPVVEEQAVIDLMRWMWKANPVLSLTGMAEYLNSAEVKTRTGVPWSPATVSSIQKHNQLEADLETRSYAPRPNRRERGVTTIGGQQNSYANSA